MYTHKHTQIYPIFMYLELHVLFLYKLITDVIGDEITMHLIK